MKTYGTIEEALKDNPDAYVTFERIGKCMVCEREEDLRAGACFDCADKVSGEKINGGHRLWETANPSNTWYAGDL